MGQPWVTYESLLESLAEAPSLRKAEDESSSYHPNEASCCSSHKTFPHPWCPTLAALLTEGSADLSHPIVLLHGSQRI